MAQHKRDPDAAEIRQAVRALLPETIRLRRHLHRHPELSDREFKTAALVRRELKRWTALRLLPPFLGTDVVGLLQGARPGPNITLRADLDALPLREETGLPYRSRRPGVMHACGHDGHTAMLLCAARVLSRWRARLAGSVRFVFQPGEEQSASGRRLVERGALKNPRPAMVLALHGWGDMPVGAVGSRPGPFMAAADTFAVTVLGRGGHAARPESTVDPILTAAQIVQGLQAIVARRISPLTPAVVSVCRLRAGTASNIIPDSAQLVGTIRYLDPRVGERIGKLLGEIVAGCCAAAGAQHRIAFERTYLPTVNHRSAVALGRRAARETLGRRAWVALTQPSLGAEDFAFYLQEQPGAMFRLGLGEDRPPLHSPRFDFNDEALENGIVFLVAAALRWLER